MTATKKKKAKSKGGSSKRSRGGPWWLWALLAIGVAIGVALPLVERLGEVQTQHRLLDLELEIGKASEQWGLNPGLVASVVRAESSGRPDAVSRVGAKGLMQIMPQTHSEVCDRLKMVGDGDLFDGRYNLQVGCAYLAYLCDRFDGDWYAIMAAYHMGPTRVAFVLRHNPGWTGRELIETEFTGPQTRKYVHKVMDYWQENSK